MKGQYSRKETDIADSIQSYGFAANVEVTNTLANPAEKIEEALYARSYLKSITKNQVSIASGLVYHGPWVDPGEISGLDFIVDVCSYEPKQLEVVAYRLVAKKLMGTKLRDLLGIILTNCSEEFSLEYYLDSTNNYESSRILGMDEEKYLGVIGDLKGYLMEMYSQHLFSDLLEDKKIIFRHKFSHSPRDSGKNNISDADNIIICPQKDLQVALKKIDSEEDIRSWIAPRFKAC